MSTEQHRQAAEGQSATCCVLTVSDTRTEDTDTGGGLICEQLRAADHTIAHYAIVPDEPDAIDAKLRAWLDDEPDVIITTGGTGIARRDTTIEVVDRMIDKPLEGFGELFRMLSYEQVGAAAMLSRATGGLCGETLLFALPGSSKAVELAMSRLLIPELPHLVWERRR